jgi:hemimethylated DNA binding protein
VFHRLHQYRAVIVGWDSECQASEKWIETVCFCCFPGAGGHGCHHDPCVVLYQMQVNRLPRGRAQPFYKLLVDCRDRPQSQQLAYVAEENIGEIPAFSDEIQHTEIGRYFRTVSRGPPTIYSANVWLSAQYPEDGVVAAASAARASDEESDVKM